MNNSITSEHFLLPPLFWLCPVFISWLPNIPSQLDFSDYYLFLVFWFLLINSNKIKLVRCTKCSLSEAHASSVKFSAEWRKHDSKELQWITVLRFTLTIKGCSHQLISEKGPWAPWDNTTLWSEVSSSWSSGDWTLHQACILGQQAPNNKKENITEYGCTWDRGVNSKCQSEFGNSLGYIRSFIPHSMEERMWNHGSP